MKERVKDSILSISIFYMIVIVILTIITYCNMVTKIEFSSADELQNNELIEYKEIISKYEDSTCKNYINTLINKIEKDIYKSEIDLKGSYEEIINDSLLDYYGKARESCVSITSEKLIEEKMPVKFLTSTILVDEILSKYFFQYELSFKDIKMREIGEASLESVENNIKIQNELQIVNSLLKIIEWEKEV